MLASIFSMQWDISSRSARLALSAAARASSGSKTIRASMTSRGLVSSPRLCPRPETSVSGRWPKKVPRPTSRQIRPSVASFFRAPRRRFRVSSRISASSRSGGSRCCSERRACSRYRLTRTRSCSDCRIAFQHTESVHDCVAPWLRLKGRLVNRSYRTNAVDDPNQYGLWVDLFQATFLIGRPHPKQKCGAKGVGRGGPAISI